MLPDETRLTGLLAQARYRLLDTRVCPACGRPLLGQGCAGCGLDVSGDVGLLLWDASLEVVRALEEREDLIATVRSAQRSAPLAPRPVQAPSAPVAYEPPPFVPVPPPAAPRAPWRVQTVLQVLGVALLATASIVFLVFSWNVLSVAARGTVIGLGTVVVLALAAWLLRRGLDQSAQAVGALGVVLVLLDAWAVHATGLAGPTDPAAYAAAACLVCAGLLGAYGAASGVRAGTVATAVLLPLAPLMLLGHTSSAVAAAGLLLAALALTTLRFVPGPRLAAERATLATAAVVCAVAAALTGVLGVQVGDDDAQRWASTGVLLGVAVVCAVQALLAAFVARRAGRATTAGRAWSVGAGVLAAVVATAAAAILGLPAVTGPAALGVLLGLVLAAWPVSRAGHGLARAGTGGATLAALVVGVPTVLVLLAEGVEAVAAPSADAWATATEPLVGSVALVALLAVVGLRAGSRAAAARHGAAALSVAVVLVGSVTAGSALAGDPRLGATAALLAVATGAAVVDAARRGPARWYLRGTAVLAVSGALAASLGLPWWTGAALVAATLLALSARRWGGGTPVATQSAVAGATLGWAAVAQLAFAAGSAPDVAVSGASALAVATLTGVALASRLSAVERHALLAVAGALGAAGWVVGVAALPEQGRTPTAVVTLAVAATVWAATVAVAVRGRRALAPAAALLGTALVAPVGALTALTAHVLTRVPGPTPLPLVLVVLGGVAVVAAGLVPRSPVDARPALELSGWAVVALGLLLAAARSADLAAVALLLAAVVAGASAARPDRRGERWLALGLVVVASWCSLGARGVGTPEAYLAPLGVVLAVVGVRRWHRGRPAAELLGGGLALITLPVAVVDDPLVLGATVLSRTALASVLAALLVAVALVVAHRRRPHLPAAGTDPLLTIATLAALLAALAPGRTAAVLAATSWTADATVGAPVELWALTSAAILAGAAVATLRAPVDRPATVQRAAVWTVLLVATVPAVLTHDDGPTGLARILVVGVLGTWLAARGADRSAAVPTAWAWSPDLLPQGLVLVGAATQAALLRTWPVPYDAILAVTGAVLVLVGVLRLRRDPLTGTWVALGPGLVGLLMLPTLTALATGTPWRVGLVVVGGLLAVGAGARWRWQAPFVVGAATLALELVAQLLPVTRAALGDLGWWPVLAVGGAALLALGLTYERRLRDAREAARYVAAMR